MPLSPQAILDAFQATPSEEAWAFRKCTPSDTGKWTHDYHRYPAKFIPQLVERLLDEYITTPTAHINDPFMGCGTTIVTAIARGFYASGTDINRIAHLIARVKATPIEPNYLAQRIDHLFRLVKEYNPRTARIEPRVPERHIERIRYWFNESTIHDLGILLNLIHREEDARVRDFFLVAFSHILKRCSLWLQASTKPTRDVHKQPVAPFDAFRQHIKKMQDGNAAFYDVVPARVREAIDDYLNVRVGDARAQPVPSASVDLIVTSSPYVTSYAYADLHQLSTLWLDLTDDWREYRKEFIGAASTAYRPRALKSVLAQNIVAQLASRSPKMARDVETFFADMQEVFDESFRILKSGGRCCYVIGNTQLKGVDILNAQVFAESLQHSGFRLDRIIKREIPSKILPQKRDKKTGRFAKNQTADAEAYPVEYIVIGLKE
ncbi:MAG: site-specific DNA-methyltransferase [Anaerolineae bacterium]|nr:site-specific DNA-methyltransferase [Anaerolineae bacterium]